MNELKALIRSDYYRYLGPSADNFKSRLKFFVTNPNVRMTVYYRHICKAKNRFSRLFWNCLYRHCTHQYGTQIPKEVTIGPGFRIGHWGGIVINSDTVAGSNLTVMQGVLIGHSLGKKVGVPKIGDNVYIGANSCVIGGITIGDNVLIAPNTMVNVDVPANSIAIGSPANIITDRETPSWPYIMYAIDPVTYKLVKR